MPTLKRTETDYTTVAIAALAGTAAGLTVGLLLAPKSGEKLREDLGHSVDDYIGTARRKAEEIKTSAANLVQRTKDAAANRTDAAGDAAAGKAHQAADAIRA